MKNHFSSTGSLLLINRTLFAILWSAGRHHSPETFYDLFFWQEGQLFPVFVLSQVSQFKIIQYAKVACFEVACHKPLHYLQYEINILSWKALVTCSTLGDQNVHSLTLNSELCILGFQMFSEFYSQIIFQNLYMFECT